MLAGLLLAALLLPGGQAKPSVGTDGAGRSGPVDLNSATFAQLRALPGMGDEYVRRVMAGRPYWTKNQLVSRGILPQNEYQLLAPLVVAHRHEKVTQKW